MDIKENGYTLCFEENFDGELETNKWLAADEIVKSRARQKGTYTGPTHVNTEVVEKHDSSQLHYCPENVFIRDGKLVIKADRDEGDGFTGGKVCCNGFAFSHGYFETLVRLPKPQKGVWPVIEVVTTDGTLYGTVLDVVSVRGDEGKNLCGLFIDWTDDIYETKSRVDCMNGPVSDKAGYPKFYPAAGSDEKLSDDWHTFALQWTDEFAVFYCDGAEYCRADLNDLPLKVFAEKNVSKISIGLSVGLPVIDAPEEDGDFPVEFVVDYIRLYKKDGDFFVKR